MPLAFNSLSHGRIAFGFFNIDIDLLLLDNLFFFAPDFCDFISRLAATRGDFEATLPGWRIDETAEIGNLHGAIAGQDLSGFIGATYARWPFPRDERLFRQKPEGVANRDEARSLIQTWGSPLKIALSAPAEGLAARIGAFSFDRLAFLELVRYVWVGGMPRWRENIKPAYVTDMGRAASSAAHPLLNGLDLQNTH